MTDPPHLVVIVMVMHGQPFGGVLPRGEGYGSEYGGQLLVAWCRVMMMFVVHDGFQQHGGEEMAAAELVHGRIQTQAAVG